MANFSAADSSTNTPWKTNYYSLNQHSAHWWLIFLMFTVACPESPAATSTNTIWQSMQLRLETKIHQTLFIRLCGRPMRHATSWISTETLPHNPTRPIVDIHLHLCGRLLTTKIRMEHIIATIEVELHPWRLHKSQEYSFEKKEGYRTLCSLSLSLSLLVNICKREITLRHGGRAINWWCWNMNLWHDTHTMNGICTRMR